MHKLCGILVGTVLLLLVEASGTDFPNLQYIRTIPSDTINTLFGSRIVQVGDQDQDGLSDLLISSLANRSYFFLSSYSWDTAHFVVDSTDYTSVSNCGDLNGDSYVDFSISRPIIGRRIEAYFGGPGIDAIPDAFFGRTIDASVGPGKNGMDIDQDGNQEYITTGELGYKRVQIYDLGISIDSIPELTFGPVFAGPYAAFGESIVFGYFNSDSLLDFAVNFRPRAADSLNGEIQFYFNSSTFDTIPDFVIRRTGQYAWGNERFGRILATLGDVNGDGYDDIFACPGQSFDTVSFVYFCGPLLDTVPDVTIPFRPEVGNYLGDVNNDGFNDLIASLPSTVAGINKVWIYLGGPSMDSIPDVTITQSDLPNVVSSFGQGISGVGDVTGDGVDDFAISADRATNQGVVYIYAGWDMGTDVVDEENQPAPSSFELHQNYPNPFNPNTKIEFTLATRCNVEISIYNLIGELVRTLTKHSYSAGSHSVIWDGTTDE